jgi:hypothetical protein
MLLSGCLDGKAELKQMVALDRVKQVVLAQGPCLLEHAQNFN